jgi:hypothetical protein
MDPFFAFLVSLSQELTTKEWEDCFHCFNISPKQRESIKSATEFLKWMNKKSFIDSSNFEELKRCFGLIKRIDLIKKIEEYEHTESKKLKNVDIIPIEHIKKESKIIGQGAYGVVYKAKYKGTPVAVKEIILNMTRDAERNFRKEINIMR